LVRYETGDGLPKNDAKAVHWWTKAAKQGVADAQYSLGLMYAKGRGVPENYVRGYAWVSTAAAQGKANRKKAKEVIAQIAEGQKLSRGLWEKYVVPIQKE